MAAIGILSCVYSTNGLPVYKSIIEILSVKAFAIFSDSRTPCIYLSI